jgi:hypothetical protein
MAALNKMDALVHGVNVTYCCGIALSDARGAGSPEEQVERAINALFHEGHAGKPHLLPRGEELLRKYQEFKRSGEKAELPKPVPDITRR